MPKLWVLRGLKEGILTTKYPKNPASRDEVPRRNVPPLPTRESDWEKGAEICPTGAIQSRSREDGDKVDLGRCVYCRRCASAGFEFSDEASQSALKASYVRRNDRENAIEQIASRYEEKWKTFNKSFHVLMIDVGSCNACNLEVLNLSNPYYDLNRLGIFFTNSPKHADALIVVGALNKSMVDVLKRTYENIPNPKLVIAVGACPISGGVFQGTDSFVSPINDVIPVDVEVPGCPPSPIQILQGLLLGMGKLKPTEVV